MLFVAFKPPNISSNAFLATLKRKFNTRDLGYSGTLDPFASGTLVVASGTHTRLFSHFHLSPKIYRATLWLGLKSPTLDISAPHLSVQNIVEIPTHKVESTLQSLVGTLTYTPPKFSAKKVGGIRAYNLARENADFALPPCQMQVFHIALLAYNHPFLSFEVSVSKGAYIRSLGEIIAQKLGTVGALSALVRIREGDFIFSDYKMLNVLDFLHYPRLNVAHLRDDFYNGKKFSSEIFENICEIDSRESHKDSQDLQKKLKNFKYITIFKDFFSIISHEKYILNRISLC